MDDFDFDFYYNPSDPLNRSEDDFSTDPVKNYLYSSQFDPVKYQTAPIDYNGITVTPDNFALPTGSNAFGEALSKLFSAEGLKKFFDPSTGAGLLALMGVSGLADKMGFFNAPVTKVGFQGTIPALTATRTQTHYAQPNDLLRLKSAAQNAMASGATLDEVKKGALQNYGISPAQVDAAMSAQGQYRRPGAGGITYFNPVQYGLGQYTPTEEQPQQTTGGSISPTAKAASGGIADLARGRFLRGGGDGVSDSIPAKFADSGKPAALADGEFVIPARVVSELGNGSSEAGARKLYAMLDRVERAAKGSKRGGDTRAEKYLPA